MGKNRYIELSKRLLKRITNSSLLGQVEPQIIVGVKKPSES